MKTTRFLLAASILLASAFNFSCSSDDGGKEVISAGSYTIVNYDANGEISSTSTSRWENKFDSRGYTKKQISYGSNGSVLSINEFEWNNNGNWTKMISYNADGNMTSKTELEYDSKGNVTKQIYYNADGSMTNKIEYEYDSKGNTTKVFSYNADGNMTNKIEYDSKGNKAKEISYNADGVIIGRTEYDWNGDGSFCIYTEYNNKGEISSTGEERYTTINSKKQVISEIRTSSSGSGSKTEYEYDSRGNFTKQTSYSRKSDTDPWIKSYEITYTYTYITI